MAFSRAVLSGVVTREPEKRFTPNNTAVAQFAIQVAGAGANEAAFTVEVTCWRQLADVAAERVRQGDAVVVEGRLQIHRTESAGNYHSNYEIDAANIYLGSLELLPGNAPASTAGSSQRQPAMAAAPSAPQPAAQQMGSDFLATEDDIPF